MDGGKTREAIKIKPALFFVSYLICIVFSQKYWDAPFIIALLIGLPLVSVVYFSLLTIFEILIKPLLGRPEEKN
jgi:hypothetical protein